MEFDLFISHASEDKDDLVRDLAHSLESEGFSVWYDEFEMRLGDSISEKVDYGLSKSRFGLVILSPAFFGKNWPKRELRDLVARDVSEKMILPVWHNVTKEDVLRFSPPLADALAVSTSDGLEKVVKRIREVLVPIDFKSLPKEPASKCPMGMEYMNDELTKACEDSVSNEAIRLIGWKFGKDKNFLTLFRERRRGLYYQALISKNYKDRLISLSLKLSPKFILLLEPDRSLWFRLTRSASVADWRAIDELVYLSLSFSDCELKLLGQYSIGEDVADEALGRYGLYMPDINLLPALVFESRKRKVILVVYLKHPDGFAKEAMLCDDNTNECTVFHSLTCAQESLSTKLS